MPSSTAESNSFTSADRIRQLGDIDARVPQALSAASNAVRSITGSSNSADDLDTTSPSAQDSFERHTTAFYAEVQAITALLRRQAYALEEAGIITASKESNLHLQPPPPPPSALAGRAGLPVAGGGRPAVGTVGSGQARKEFEQMPITNGGLGNLDIGWLNSRRDTIGKQKEGGLWKEARRMLEKLVSQEMAKQDTPTMVGKGNDNKDGNGSAQEDKNDDDDDMDVDG